MKRTKLWVAMGVASSLAAASATTASAAPAGVTLGEVRVTEGGIGVERRFRSIVRSEFDRLAGVRRAGKSYVVSAALLKFEKSSEPRVRCVVSAMLRDRRGGSLEAILRGEASVLGGEAPVYREAEAMRTAVRSALSRLDDALAQLH